MDSVSHSKSFDGELYKSTVYSAAEAPALGIAQILDGGSGKLTEPVKQAFNKIGVSAPESAEFNTAGWYGQVVGGAIGMLLPVGLIGRGSRALLHSSAEAGVLSQRAAIGFSIKESAFTGGVYGSFFTPSEGKDLLTERITGGVVSAETFGLLTAGNLAIGNFARTSTAASLGLAGALKNPIISGTLSGIPGGAINAENEALKKGHWFFDGEELAKEVYTMSIVGGLFGAKAKLYDQAPAPTVERTPTPTPTPAPTEQPVREVAAPTAPEVVSPPVQVDMRSFRLLERLKTIEQTGKPDMVATDEANALVKLSQQSVDHAAELANIVGSRGEASKLVSQFLMRSGDSAPPSKTELRELHASAENAIAARQTLTEWQSEPLKHDTKGLSTAESELLRTVHRIDPSTTNEMVGWLRSRNQESELAAKELIDIMRSPEKLASHETFEVATSHANFRANEQVNALAQLAGARNALYNGDLTKGITLEQGKALITFGETNPAAGQELVGILAAHDPSARLAAQRLLSNHQDPIYDLYNIEGDANIDIVTKNVIKGLVRSSTNAQRALEMLEQPQPSATNSAVPYGDLEAYVGLRKVGLMNEADRFEAMLREKHGPYGDIAMSNILDGAEKKQYYDEALKHAAPYVDVAKQAEKIEAAFAKAVAAGATQFDAAAMALKEFPLPRRPRHHREFQDGFNYSESDYKRLTKLISENEIAAIQRLAEHSKDRPYRLANIIGARGAEAEFMARYLADSPYATREDLAGNLHPVLTKFGDALRLTRELSEARARGESPPADTISIREAKAILQFETSHYRYHEAVAKESQQLRDLITERGPVATWMLNFLRSRHALSSEQRFDQEEMTKLENTRALQQSHFEFARDRKGARAWNRSHQLGPISPELLDSYISLSNRMHQVLDIDAPKLLSNALLEMAADARVPHIESDALPGIYARITTVGKGSLHQHTAAELTSAGRAWAFEPSMPADLAMQVGELSVPDRVAAASAWLRSNQGDSLPGGATQVPQGFWPLFTELRNLPVNRNMRNLESDQAIRPLVDYLYPSMAYRSQFASELFVVPDRYGVMANIKPRDFDAAFKHLQETQRESMQQREREDDSPYLSFLRQDHDTDHIVEPGPAALQLARTFGGGWKEWLISQSNLGRSLHDATYWLPVDGKPVTGLGQFLRDNSPRATNRLEIVAKRWHEVPVEMREGNFDEVLKHLLSVTYPNSKDAKFAEEAASWGVSQEDYAKWEPRYLKAKDVPSPFPTTKTWNEGGLVGRFMRRDDPRGLFLGQHTNCCQHPGNSHGEASAWNGLENPKAGYFVVERVHGKDENAPREIIAQSWAWISDAGNLVFDNVEAKTLGPREETVRKIYQRAANDLTEQFPIVTLGTTHGDLKTDSWTDAGDAFQALPKGYRGNSDAQEGQVLLARRDH